MRKTVTLLLMMLLLFCSCGEGETSKKLLPLELSVKSAFANEVVILAENSGEEKIRADGASLFRLEDKEETGIGDYVRFIDEELEYSVLPGETAEWALDIEKLFGEIPAGKYKMTFGGFENGGRYNGNWYKEITFEITETESTMLSSDLK